MDKYCNLKCIFKKAFVLKVMLTLYIILFTYKAHSVENDFQLWTSIIATGPILKERPKIKYWLEYQGRFGENASTLSQLMLRPGLGYQYSPSTSLWGGFAWVRNDLPLASRRIEERRIWQQLLWSNHFNTYTLMLRSRLEERFIPNGLHIAWRYRQLFKVGIFIPHHERFALVASEELFYHINNFNKQNNHGLEQNRAFLGIGYSTTKKSTLEVGYLNQNVRRVHRGDFNGNCFYLSLLINN